jgi:hypothetical protein
MFKSTGSRLGFFAAAAMFLGGCGGQQVPLDEVEGDPQAWWDNPGLIQDCLAAVGVAPLLNERAIGPTRTSAEMQGRGVLAATLKARITQLVEDWSKNVGDLNKEASFSSYINNEAMTRQFVEAEIKGAYPYKYHQTKTNVYVLMVLKNPEQWVANLANEYGDQILKDETLLKTEVMKNEFRQRMDNLKDAEVNKMRQQQEKFNSAIGAASQPAPQS